MSEMDQTRHTSRLKEALRPSKVIPEIPASVVAVYYVIAFSNHQLTTTVWHVAGVIALYICVQLASLELFAAGRNCIERPRGWRGSLMLSLFSIALVALVVAADFHWLLN